MWASSQVFTGRKKRKRSRHRLASCAKVVQTEQVPTHHTVRSDESYYFFTLCCSNSCLSTVAKEGPRAAGHSFVDAVEESSVTRSLVTENAKNGRSYWPADFYVDFDWRTFWKGDAVSRPTLRGRSYVSFYLEMLLSIWFKRSHTEMIRKYTIQLN